MVQTTNNDYYLTRDYWGDYDKAGTLYFDYRNDLNAGATNRNLIIYGHNIKSGLMFSHFNRLVGGNLMRARKLTTLSLNTLYDRRTYKVFAVGVFNTTEDEGPVFNYLRTKFSSEEDFLEFVAQVRRRSLFTFGDVNVQAGDEILTMSSCTNRRESHLKDGRVVVFARRVREGEEATVDTAKTVNNADVLMPWAWYVNQGLSVPKEYTNFNPAPTTTTKATTTKRPTSSKVTGLSSATQTVDGTTISTDSTSTTLPTSGTTTVQPSAPTTTVGSTTVTTVPTAPAGTTASTTTTAQTTTQAAATTESTTAATTTTTAQTTATTTTTIVETTTTIVETTTTTVETTTTTAETTVETTTTTTVPTTETTVADE